MTEKTIDFWFDFASPYAYFASRHAETLAAKHGYHLNWRPIMLWAVLRALDMPAPLDSPNKAAYMHQDMARSAKFFGAPFGLPKPFPVSTHLQARLFYQLDNDAQRQAFVHASFATAFVERKALNDPATIIECAKSIDIEESFAADALNSEAGKTALKQAVEDAIAAGVFGVPFIIVNDHKGHRESFFGADRLPQLEWHLNNLEQQT